MGLFDDSFSYEQRDMAQSLAELFECQADGAGRFIIPDLPRGARFSLAAEADGLGQAQFRNPGGGIEPDLEMKLETEGRLAGRILAPDGVPVSAARVTARRLGAAVVQLLFEAVTTTDGSFEIGGLGADPYAVMVKLPHDSWMVRPVAAAAVRAGETTTIEITAERALVVTGTVRDLETGDSLANVPVVALAGGTHGPWVGSCVTDALGHYSIRVPAGAIHVYLSGVPRGYAYPNQSGVAADASDELTVVDFSLPKKPTGAIQVIVTNVQGRPMSGVPVSLIQDESSKSASAPRLSPGMDRLKTDIEGKAFFTNLPAGLYTVRAGPYFPVESEPLRVESGPVQCRIVLDASNSIALEVVDESGAAAPSCIVAIGGEGSLCPVVLRSEELPKVLEQLPSGSYVIRAQQCQGFSDAVERVTLAGGEARQVRLILAKR
ncbi:MAG: carboxypeptidase-like regulatory domain-containing protein [Planctomycetota bacterium]